MHHWSPFVVVSQAERAEGDEEVLNLLVLDLQVAGSVGSTLLQCLSVCESPPGRTQSHHKVSPPRAC